MWVGISLCFVNYFLSSPLPSLTISIDVDDLEWEGSLFSKQIVLVQKFLRTHTPIIKRYHVVLSIPHWKLYSMIGPFGINLPFPVYWDLGYDGALPERAVAPVSQILISTVIFFFLLRVSSLASYCLCEGKIGWPTGILIAHPGKANLPKTSLGIHLVP